MILSKLQKIADLGSESPFFMWQNEYNEMSQTIIPDLQSISNRLHDITDTKKRISHLIEILDEVTPNELALAQAILYVSEIVYSNTPKDKQEIVNTYIQTSRQFYDRAQTAEFHRREREQLKSSLGGNEQKEYDLRLFEHEGMMYCLEFYLTLYKALMDAPTEEKKRQLIENSEVNLGFGNVPGLWADFKQDEVLTKFIYKILDNETRTKLTRAYYKTKKEVMKLNVRCNKQGECHANYNDTSPDQISVEVKHFLNTLLKSFQLIGIERLTSLFFTPYGNQPKLSEIKL